MLTILATATVVAFAFVFITLVKDVEPPPLLSPSRSDKRSRLHHGLKWSLSSSWVCLWWWWCGHGEEKCIINWNQLLLFYNWRWGGETRGVDRGKRRLQTIGHAHSAYRYVFLLLLLLLFHFFYSGWVFTLLVKVLLPTLSCKESRTLRRRTQNHFYEDSFRLSNKKSFFLLLNFISAELKLWRIRTNISDLI